MEAPGGGEGGGGTGEAHAGVKGEWIVVGFTVGRCWAKGGRRSREAIACERREAREVGPGACGKERDA